MLLNLVLFANANSNSARSCTLTFGLSNILATLLLPLTGTKVIGTAGLPHLKPRLTPLIYVKSIARITTNV